MRSAPEGNLPGLWKLFKYGNSNHRNPGSPDLFPDPRSSNVVDVGPRSAPEYPGERVEIRGFVARESYNHGDQ